MITNTAFSANSSTANSSTLDGWIGRLFEEPELLQMGHCQRLEDQNLGLGWLYYGFARLIRPQTIVSIGSWRGFVPLVFGKALADNAEEGRVVFIDPSLVDDFWKDPAAVRRHFAAHDLTNVQHFRMTTQEFVQSDAYRSLGDVGIVMVDGYHTAEQARFDYDAFVRFVPSHGVTMLHDSLDLNTVKLYGPDRAYQRTVKYFVDQLKADSALQVIDLPFAKGLTLVRKCPTDGRS
jgi:hypothetical protein